jgi:DNA gyrase subunit A
VLAITANGGVIRTRVSGLRETGRDTMGVQLIHVGKKDSVVGIARNADSDTSDLEDTDLDPDAAHAVVDGAVDGSDVVEDAEDAEVESAGADTEALAGQVEGSAEDGGTVSGTEPV